MIVPLWVRASSIPTFPSKNLDKAPPAYLHFSKCLCIWQPLLACSVPISEVFGSTFILLYRRGNSFVLVSLKKNHKLLIQFWGREKHSYHIFLHILWIITFFFEENAPKAMLLFSLSAATGQVQKEIGEVHF